MMMEEWIARLRVRLSRGVRRVLLGRIAGNLPNRNVRSVEESAATDAVAPHFHCIRHAQEASTVSFPFPDAYPPFFRRSKAFDPRLTYDLTDVCVSPRSGLVWTPEGHVLQESVGSLNRLLSWGDVIHDVLLSVEPLEEDDPIIPCPSMDNYYHWLIEALPNVLAMLAMVPAAKLVLHEDAPDYVHQSLTWALGSSTFSSRALVRRGPVRVRRAVLRALPPFSGFFDPNDIALLRDRKRKRHDSYRDADFRLYVSRRRSPKRRLRGEEQLEKVLRAEGFKILCAEEHSFSQQVELFARARIVVAPHGAGLSNVVWMPSSACVIEIFPHNVFNDCFARLAVHLGMKYDYVVSHPDPSSCGRIPEEAVLHTVEASTDARIRSKP